MATLPAIPKTLTPAPPKKTKEKRKRSPSKKGYVEVQARLSPEGYARWLFILSCHGGHSVSQSFEDSVNFNYMHNPIVLERRKDTPPSATSKMTSKGTPFESAASRSEGQ